jgi:MSHA biogenesis protein MshQ
VAFSYQGQPISFAPAREPNLIVTGYNRVGAVTRNYDRGSFWRLSAPAVGAYTSITAVAGRDARLLTQGTASVATNGSDDGDGTRSYRWSGQTLAYTPAALPSSDDYPFAARIQQLFSAAALTDVDGACYGSGASCQDYSYNFSDNPGSLVQLGRLRIGNAHGSELQSLSLPMTLESWQNVAAGSFQLETTDTCSTAAVMGAPALSVYNGNLAAGETLASLSGPTNGRGLLMLSAPGSGNDGTLLARLSTLPAWLHYDWDGSGRIPPRGLASFGIYKGATPLIFRRELYR